jgi:hypothetical protein
MMGPSALLRRFHANLLLVKGAFERQGITLTDQTVQSLMFTGVDSGGYPTSLKFQDTGNENRANTRAAVERVATASQELRAALTAAYKLVMQDTPADKINLANQLYFDDRFVTKLRSKSFR